MLAHPAVLAIVFFLIALVVMLFVVPWAAIISVGAILILIGALGLGAALGTRNGWVALIAFLLLLIGVGLVAFGAAIPLIVGGST
jgi:energy-coupling factor transporter transmembrane protein EcfT